MRPITDINEGWKLHLNVPESLAAPSTQAIAAYCQAHDIPHKIGKTDQAGKGMTIYLGTRARMDAVVNAIEGMNLNIPDMVGEALVHDMPVGKTGKIHARFWAGYCEQQPGMSRYGEGGLPHVEADKVVLSNLFWAKRRDSQTPDEIDGKPKTQFLAAAWKRSFDFLSKEYGETFTGVPDGQTPQWAESYLNRTDVQRINTDKPDQPQQAASGFDKFLQQRKNPEIKPRASFDDVLKDLKQRQSPAANIVSQHKPESNFEKALKRHLNRPSGNEIQ